MPCDFISLPLILLGFAIVVVAGGAARVRRVSTGRSRYLSISLAGVAILLLALFISVMPTAGCDTGPAASPTSTPNHRADAGEGESQFSISKSADQVRVEARNVPPGLPIGDVGANQVAAVFCTATPAEQMTTNDLLAFVFRSCDVDTLLVKTVTARRSLSFSIAIPSTIHVAGQDIGCEPAGPCVFVVGQGTEVGARTHVLGVGRDQ